MRSSSSVAVTISALALGVSAPDRASAEAIGLALDPPGPHVLGEVGEIAVTITAPETPDTAERPLRVSVNVGQFGAVKRVRSGVYRTLYTPPSTRFPQVALVAVWRETGPDATVDFLRIPLSGRTRVPVRSKRGSTIHLMVGETSYGPVVADRAGNAVLTIAVPPGVVEVVGTSTKDGEVSQGTVPVEVPPYNRLTLAVTPYLIPADGATAVTAHVFYDVPGDEAPPIERVKLTADRGGVRAIGREGSRYRFQFVPARETSAADVTLTATMFGDRASRAEAKVTLGVPAPERIIRRGPSAPLVAGASRSSVRVLVIDRLGLGVPNIALTATVSSNAEIAEIAEVGFGEYEVSVIAPERYPANGSIALDIAHAPREGQRLAARFDLPVQPPPWPESASMELEPPFPIADGESPFTLYVRAFDAAGAPFAGGGLSIDAKGSARASSIEALGEGRYRATVVPKSGAESIDLVLSHEKGRFREIRRASLRKPPDLLTLGARAGLAHHAHLVPLFGLEAAIRPSFLARRLSFYLGASYRRISRRLELPTLPPFEAALELVPLSAGLMYDLHAEPSWRIYGGAGFNVVPFAYRIEGDIQDPTIVRSIAFGAEALAGIGYEGVFFELMVSHSAISISGLEVPSPLLGAAIGYRLGVLE